MVDSMIAKLSLLLVRCRGQVYLLWKADWTTKSTPAKAILARDLAMSLFACLHRHGGDEPEVADVASRRFVQLKRVLATSNDKSSSRLEIFGRI